jgi:hypothetical protein
MNFIMFGKTIVKLIDKLHFNNVFLFIQLKLTSLNHFHAHQDFKHIHARIVCVLRLLLFVATKSAPPENIRSTGTLVA